MNKFKLVLWIIILGIIALVIFQNQTFFLGSQSLKLNLWLGPEVQSPPIPNAVIFLVTFVCGLVLSYLFSVPERFRNRKAIKRLKAAEASQKDEIDRLKKEIATLKGETASESEDAAQLPEKVDNTDASAGDPDRENDKPVK